NAVNEILRFTPQARMIQRYAMQDVAYGGLKFPTDSVVFCCITSANRDPRVFEDATTLDIQRRPSSRQLVFGGGIHHCLGQALARLEPAGGPAPPSPRFGPPGLTAPITWRPALAMIPAPDSLPITFAEADAAAPPSLDVAA